MRNGQNNKQRMRGRNNHHNNMNNNRRGQNPMTRVYESNGPEIKIRGTASHLAEKYVQLARDALGSGDPVAAENFYQHAEHYFRIIAAAQEQLRQNQPNQGQPRFDGDSRDDMNDDGADFSSFGTEPGFPREQPQPNYQPREPQPHQGQQQREHQQRDQGPRERNYRDNRPQQQQPPQSQPQPIETHSIDRLPSFITGGQPQPDAAMSGSEPPSHEERPDRYPRRRRRPHNPRHESAGAPAAAADDVNTGD